MAVNRVPVLKRCRSLGLDPIYLGIDKKSNRELKRANRKVSEYGLQLREKQKAKFIYGVPKRDQPSDCRNRRILHRKRGACQDYILGRRIYAGKCRDPSVFLRAFTLFSGRCDIF